MAWTPFQLVIAFVMVSTGSINTLAAKWANFLYAENSIGAEIEFNHPYLQADAMFVGEFLCMFAFIASSCMSSRKNKTTLYIQTDGLNKEVSAKQMEESEAKDDEDNKDGERKRTRSRTYSVDVINNPINAAQVGKKPFGIRQSYLMIPASFCDMCGTCLMYVSLTLTSAGSFQMMRGFVIIFTGLNSVIFLKARLKWFQWTGMCVVLLGLAITGIPDIKYPTESTCFGYPDNTTTTESSVPTTVTTNGLTTTNPYEEYDYQFDVYRLEPMCVEDGAGGVSDEILGDALIACAQIIVSLQMVYEEKVLTDYDIAPLQAVGWEGFWGFWGMSICLVIFYFIPVQQAAWSYDPTPPYHLEDSIDGFIQLGNNPLLLVAIMGTIFSIAFFNYAGQTVTKELSATTRMVLDSVRTLVIWAFSISIGWQKFQYLQAIGFVVLLTGMSLYNDLLIMPAIRNYMEKKKARQLGQD